MAPRTMKEHVEKVSAAVVEAAEASGNDIGAHRKLLRTLSTLKIALSNLTGAQKREINTVVRGLVNAIQAYHIKQAHAGSDCVIQVFCDVLHVAYDGSTVSECMEILVSKTSSLGAKLTISRAMAQWSHSQLHSATGYIPELINLASKHSKHADIYVRHTLVSSLARVLATYGTHGVTHHSEAIKVGAKFISDKHPEIRSAASDLLASVIAYTDSGDQAGLDALFLVIAKDIDDPAPDLRRANAINMGKILSLYIVRSDAAPAASPPSSAGSASTLKKGSKPPGYFSSIDQAIVFIKEAFCSPNGASFASCAIMVSTLCDAVSSDIFAEPHFRAVVDSLLAFLDTTLPSLNEFVRARNALGFAFRGAAKSLNERDQHQWLRVVLTALDNPDLTYHQRLVLVIECSHLFHALGEASVVYAEGATATLSGLLHHEKHSVRLEAAVGFASLATAVPYRRQSILDDIFVDLEKAIAIALPEGPSQTDTAALYALQGQCATITHILRAAKLSGGPGFSLALYENLLNAAEKMVVSQFTPNLADPIWLTCTRAGWELVGSLLSLHGPFTQTQTPRLCRLWSQALTPQAREPAQELLRLEGAIISLFTYLMTTPAPTDLAPFFVQLLHGVLIQVQKSGVPTKQRAKVAKHRIVSWLLKCFACLPPTLFADTWIPLLDLVAELTTAQPLTSLEKSSLVPPATTLLSAGGDFPSQARLISGDSPDPIYAKELNLILAILQPDTAMSDIELETAYLDSYLAKVVDNFPPSSAFTYVRAVDASIGLFPGLFLALPEELQLRSLQHFAGVLADPKLAMDCVLNVSAILLATVREAQLLTRRATKVSQTAYQSATWPLTIQSMLLELLGSAVDAIRRAAAEALGIVASLLSDSNIRTLVTELETKVASHQHDATSALLAGSALALAHLKRSCGSRCVVDATLLYRLNQEHVLSMAQPLRTWSLQAWSLLLECVNTSGDYEEQYVTPSLALIELQCLVGLRFPSSPTAKKGPILRGSTSVCVSIGQVLNSIVSALGPELLAGNRVDQLYGLWDLLRMVGDPRIDLEYLRFIEQLVLFAPTYFKASDLARIKLLVRHPTTPAECRSVMLLILRILVERDPSLIAQENLHLILFQALEVHEIIKDWTFVPLLRGLYPTGHNRLLHLVQLAPIPEIQGCLNALLVTDAGVQRLHNGNKACEWLLLCRGIAVGGVASIPPVDESPRAAGVAVATDVWRRTNHRVCETLNDLPCLHRRVREFAIQCVLSVLELVDKSPVAAIHFDVAKAKASIESMDEQVNFVALYVDELVTLACQMSAFSIDGFELEALQSVGMTLLNVICGRFASSIDPDVPEETVLVQYQAQLSSTIRRAFAATVSTKSPAGPHEPLFIQGVIAVAHVVVNKIVSDPIGISRLIKYLLLPSFDFAKSSCDDVVRFRLSMTTLASLARLAPLLPDAAIFESAWLSAVLDFVALHVPPKADAAEWSGIFFRTTRELDTLKSIATSHVPALLVALSTRSIQDKKLLLTATLLYLTKPASEDIPTLLSALPALISWPQMDLATFDNLLHTLLHLASHTDEVVQITALKAIQLVITKDGASFVKSNASTATHAQIAVATTFILRKAVVSTKLASSVVLEGLRTAAAGAALLSACNETYGPAFILVVNDVLRSLVVGNAWIQPMAGLYVDATLRCFSSGSSAAPELDVAVGELIETVGWLVAQNLSNPEERESFDRMAPKLVASLMTYARNHPRLAAMYHKVAEEWAKRIVAAPAESAPLLESARSLATEARFAQSIGIALVRLLHEKPQTLPLAVVDEMEAWLTQLLSGMAPAHAETLLQVVLPLVLLVPHAAVVGRMLLGYATAFSASFKGAVGQMGSDSRAALELALRQALLDKQAAAAAPTTATTSSSMSLDLSRYG
ncbi:hypothetical protein AeMF1_002418 [Aphanomyces euteiches]|nr:hypothetical protein AeMF1_002418 [Aphanomyces euteiches]